MTYPLIYFISPRDIRKNRADAVHIVRSCQAFAENGAIVNLITPKVERDGNPDLNEIYKLYGKKKLNINLIELGTNLKENSSNETSPIFTAYQKAIKNAFFFLRNRKNVDKDTIIFSKCFISTVPVILYRKMGLLKGKLIFETITFKDKFLHRFIMNNVNGVVSHNRFVSKIIIEKCRIKEAQIYIPITPSQTEDFEEIAYESKEKYRLDFKMSSDKKYVLYAGKVGINLKEVEYFIEASKLAPEFEFLIVGASTIAYEHYTKKVKDEDIKNLSIYPFQPLTEYYKFVKAANLLVGYYSGSFHNMYQLSPGKATVYMASKNPILFSDMPSIREAYSEELINYVKPDNPNELAKSIKNILLNEGLYLSKAEKAFRHAEENTYKKYGKGILDFIENDLKK